jgi:signal transduction histidine kinase
MTVASAALHRLGISGMRDAQRAGGTLEIAGAPGGGTIVSVVLPT